METGIGALAVVRSSVSVGFMRLLLPAAVLSCGLLTASAVYAQEQSAAEGTTSEIRFKEPISAATQDVDTRDVYGLSPNSRMIRRYTAEQLAKGDATPIASATLNARPERLIVRDIGNQRFVFVQCFGPEELVQLNSETLEMIRTVPLATSMVSDLFGSCSTNDPYVWMIVDGRPAGSKSVVRRWKLVVVNFGDNQPAVADVRECSAATVSPDGHTLLMSVSGAGITKAVLSEFEKPVPVLTMQPPEAGLSATRLRPGSFFSPDQDALINGGRRLPMHPTTPEVTENSFTMGDVKRSVIGFLRSAPVMVSQTEVVGDNGIRAAGIELSESTSDEVFTTLTASDFGDHQDPGSWRVFETTDAAGLLLMSSAGCRLLPISRLPKTLAAHLSAPPMILAETPDLSFRIGVPRDVRVSASDPRCAITLKSAPDGCTFENGVFHWQPTAGQSGIHSVEFELKAGDASKRIQLRARAEFQLHTLPHKYLRMAHLPALKVLTGCRITPERELFVDVLHVKETSCELQRSILIKKSVTSPVTDMVLTSTNEGTAKLAISFSHARSVLLIDPINGTSAVQVDLPVQSVSQLSAAGTRAIGVLVWCGSRYGDSLVDTAGLIDLKSGRDLGLLTPEGDVMEVHPSRLAVKPIDPNQTPQSSGPGIISHASLSSDGRTIHLITASRKSSPARQYSEWSIPESRDGSSIELTCLHRTAFEAADSQSLHHDQLNLRIQSNGLGYAAVGDHAIVFGQLIDLGIPKMAVQHFISGRPYIVMSRQLTGTSEMPADGGIRCSLYSLNNQATVGQEFSLPLGPLASARHEQCEVQFTSDESAQELIAAFHDQLIRIPYPAMGVGADRFGPELIVRGTRTVQQGGRYEFLFDVQPPGAEVTIEEAPAGLTMENGRLTWQVPEGMAEDQVVSLKVADGDMAKSVSLKYRVCNLVPVTLGTELYSLTFDPVSEQLAAVSAADGSVVLFSLNDLRSGKAQPSRTIRLRDKVQCAALKRFGEQLLLVVVSSLNRSVSILDAESGNLVPGGVKHTVMAATEIHPARDAGSPIVVLKSGRGDSYTSGWQLLNVATGQMSHPKEQQVFVGIEDDASTVAFYDTQQRFFLASLRSEVRGELLNAELLNLRRHNIPQDSAERLQDDVDFEFRRLHRPRTVYSLSEPATQDPVTPATFPPQTEFVAYAFLRHSPFLLSVSEAPDASQNFTSPDQSERTVHLSAVSRNTLTAAGKVISLRFPPAVRPPLMFAPSLRPYQIYLAKNETEALVTNNHTCFIVPVSSLSLPDEVSLALKTDELNFRTGMQTTLEVVPADVRAKLSLKSAPDGITLTDNRLTWSPRISDSGAKSIQIELEAGDQRRVANLPVNVTLPEVRLPFDAVGISAAPDGSVLFAWSSPHVKDEIQESHVSCCVIDLKSQKVLATKELSIGMILVSLCEASHVAIMTQSGDRRNIVVLNAADLTDAGSLAFDENRYSAARIAFDRVNKQLVIPMDGQIARCSFPDLKWIGQAPQPIEPQVPHFQPALIPDGICQGPLILAPNGSPQLLRSVSGNVFRVQGNTLAAAPEPIRADNEYLSSMNFTTPEFRWIVPSPVLATHVPVVRPASDGSGHAFQCLLSSQDSHRQAQRVTLSVSPIHDDPDTDSLALQQQVMSPLTQTGVLNNHAPKEPGGVEISLIDTAIVDMNGIVAATDHHAIVAVRSRLWILPVAQLGLIKPPRGDKPNPLPRFVRRQSAFVLKGDGQTKLKHQVTHSRKTMRFIAPDPLEGIKLNSATGEVTIDHQQIRQLAIRSLKESSRVGDLNSRSFYATMNSIAANSRLTAALVVSDEKTLSSAIPFFVSISLKLQVDGQTSDSIEYVVVILIDESEFKAALDEILNAAGNRPTSNLPMTAEESRQLQIRNKELEDRLRRAEQILRQNGLPIPER